MSVFDRIKKIAEQKNAGVMEYYMPQTPSELAFWNQHIVVDHKNLQPGSTDDDKLFNASNIGYRQGKRHADKTSGQYVAPIAKEEVETPVEEMLPEEVDMAVARLRVQRAKAKKRLKAEPNNQDMISRIANINARLKNLVAAAKAKDTWAKNAEMSHKGRDIVNDDGEDD